MREKLTQLCKSNRVFRTFIQAVGAYLALNIPTFWDGGGDFYLAIKALLLGTLAAGFSALWKTADDDLKNSAQSKK